MSTFLNLYYYTSLSIYRSILLHTSIEWESGTKVEQKESSPFQITLMANIALNKYSLYATINVLLAIR